MIVKKYIFKDSGIEYSENDSCGKWADGSNMFVKESAEQHPDKWEIKELEVMTDQERQEIFDFAKELLRTSCMGVNPMSAKYAINEAKELYNLKKTI
jgi:hypothetical protein